MPLVAPFVFFRRKYVSVANKLLEDAEQFGCLVQLGGYCRRSTLSLINLAFLLAKDRLL